MLLGQLQHQPVTVDIMLVAVQVELLEVLVILAVAKAELADKVAAAREELAALDKLLVQLIPAEAEVLVLTMAVVLFTLQQMAVLE